MRKLMVLVVVVVAGCRSSLSERAMCRAFDPASFRSGRVGVAAGGDLLTYDRESLACKGASR